MKKLTNSRYLFAALIFVALGVSMLLSSCEGPAGPAGKDGPAVCNVCHGSANVALKTNQWDLSKHGTGTIYEEEAGRLQCGGCHTGDGFAEAASLGKNDPVSVSTSKINCEACHDIHDKYDTTDFKLRISSGFALRQTGVSCDFKGPGNTCAKCHQARSYARTTPDSVKPASSGATYSRFGPHYGVVANVVSMNGPVKIAGSTPYPSSNPHAGLAKGCVSCHMGTDPANSAAGGHTFKMPTANLANMKDCSTPCHDANKIKTASKAAEIKTLLAQYKQKLIDKGMLDLSQTASADGTYNILGEYPATPNGKTVVYTNPDDVSVLLNYLYIAKDRSLGVHNPDYVYALVKNGLEYLSK